MRIVASFLIEPGFFSSAVVRNALITGAIVALVSAMVGVFTVIRSQSFAGHAMSDMSTLGGSGSFLIGINPLLGFVAASFALSGTMELLGVERRRGRDVATGIVLGGALGVSALFLYLDARSQSTTGAAVTILFGSLFAQSSARVPIMIALGLGGVIVLGIIYRPLLLSSISPDLALAQGIRVRLLSFLFLSVMGVSVALTSIEIGTILSTALLIGPASSALRFSRTPAIAMLCACSIGLIASWLGILLAYDSYYWPPKQRGWPVSFFVVVFIFLFYLASSFKERNSLLRRKNISLDRDTNLEVTS